LKQIFFFCVDKQNRRNIRRYILPFRFTPIFPSALSPKFSTPKTLRYVQTIDVLGCFAISGIFAGRTTNSPDLAGA